MVQNRFQKELMKSLAQQREAREALEALPDDALASTRRQLEQVVKTADAEVAKWSAQLEDWENNKGERIVGAILFFVVCFAVIIFFMWDTSPQTRSPAVRSGCQQWLDSRWGETIEICGNAGTIYNRDGTSDRLERWRSFDGRLRGRAYVMIDRIGRPNLAYVVQSNGNMGFWTGCESGPCQRSRILSRK